MLPEQPRSRSWGKTTIYGKLTWVCLRCGAFLPDEPPKDPRRAHIIQRHSDVHVWAD